MADNPRRTPPHGNPMTPPHGTLVDDWEVSEVKEAPLVRDGRVVERSSEGRATAKKALAKIEELGRRFENHALAITRRFEQHALEDREQFGQIDHKLDGQNDTLADLRESTAGHNVHLDNLTAELRHRRELQLLEHSADVKVQAVERIAEVEDQRDTKAHKRKVVLEWSKILVAAVAAAIGALVTAAIATR